jgi:hypothetical protein
MLKSLTLAAVVAFAAQMPHGRADQQKALGDKEEQGIKAEVRGTLHFEAGRGYFISVKSGDKAEPESRVWLRVAEDKALVRQLQGLAEKEVVAKGNLGQMPENVHASVPPLGIYLHLGFEIEQAGAK